MSATALRWCRRNARPHCFKSYWTIPERQIETSVVLANPRDRS
jgi:hypothetical protein